MLSYCELHYTYINIVEIRGPTYLIINHYLFIFFFFNERFFKHSEISVLLDIGSKCIVIIPNLNTTTLRPIFTMVLSLSFFLSKNRFKTDLINTIF